jgi:multidrug transporter EmrE-like cation transporter
MSNAFAWAMVFSTIALTSYGQLVLKWQVGRDVPVPFGFMEAWPPLIQLLARPWVISAFVAAFGASLCWMLAISRLELSRAYPFMALNFVFVALVAIPLFGEVLTAPKLIGFAFVVVGLVFISQG